MSNELYNDEQLLWKDRRRRLGLPLSFTRYSLTPTHLYLSKGFFSVHEDEILLYRVLDMHLTISFMDRIFGVGTIEIISRDATNPTLELKKVKSPREVRKLLSNQIAQSKRENGVTGREMFGVDGNLDEYSDC